MAANKKPKPRKNDETVNPDGPSHRLLNRKKRIHIDEQEKELNRLMKDYGIEAGDYFSLALQLAINHVPGFPRFKLQHGSYGKVMRDKGGRPDFWTLEKLDELVIDVDDAKKKYGFATDEDALKDLTKSGKWARPASRDLNKWIKTLKNTLAHARTIRREADRLPATLE